MSRAAGYQPGVDHRHDNIYFIWDQLKQHDRYMDCFSHIHALLSADDELFQLFKCLRERDDPGAVDFREGLLLSTIHFIPPSDVYRLIVCLRTHRGWPSVRHIVVTDLSRIDQPSRNTGSIRTSGFSGRSHGHLSSGSARSYSNTPSGYSFINAVPEAADEEEKHPHAPQTDITPGPTTVTDSGRPSRKAPEGQRFSCPHRQCHGKFAYRRLGDWDNHQLNHHPGTPQLNPYKYLQEDLHVNTPTPVRMETADNPATIPYPSYFRGMGVHPLPDSFSFFKFEDDDMDDK